jgi:hypothetical protein
VIVDLATVKQDIRVTHSDDDALITRLINTAERYVVHFLGRNLYVDATALDTAKDGAEDVLVQAADDYKAALEAISDETNYDLRYMKTAQATETYQLAVQTYERTMAGVAIDDDIKTSVSLTVGDLYEHRGDEEAVIGIPASAQTYLWMRRRDLPI